MSRTLPIPIRFARFLLDRLPYPVLSTGMLFILVLVALFSVSGAYFPAPGTGWGSPLEILGAFLLFTLLPPYLSACFLAGLRTNDQTHAQLDQDLELTDRYRHGNNWPLAVLLGVIYALFANISPSLLRFDPAQPDFLLNLMLVFGQLLIWIVVSLVLFFSIHECWILGRLGKVVPINLYQLDRLNGFGRVGINNFLIVVGAMAITIVQAIDREFRPENYLNGLVVALPAALVMLALPIWSVHRRIRSAKAAAVAELDAEIVASSRGLDRQSLDHLNALLQRREYLKGLRNWPMDISIFLRLVLYAFIVPLAWAGAALMEMLLDSILGS